MVETITAQEADHHFSRILEAVAGGQEYVVTRDGVAVARLSPMADRPAERPLTADQDQALRDFAALSLANEVPENAEPAKFNRDELYDERIPKRLRDS